MSDTAQDLVDQMVEAGEWPEPALLEAIVARGDEAVGPLTEILGRDLHGWPEEAPLNSAIGLLGDLHARSAIPALLDLYRRYDDESLEVLSETLGLFGAEVIEPLLAIARDRTLARYARVTAVNAARAAAVDDPALRARITVVLREVLADCLTRADNPEDDDVYMVTSLVMDLVEFDDPLAHDLIHAAYESGLAETWFLGEEQELKKLAGRGNRQPPARSTFLQKYREQYEKHQESERRRREAPEPPPLVRPRAESLSFRPVSHDDVVSLPPVTAPIQRAEKKPGRNDPCWCGSGKKYKKCHLGQDQA